MNDDDRSFDEECYASLADEMNDGAEYVGVWNAADWDPVAVAAGKRYAKANGLSWPPQTGDYDRYAEKKYN
jgi:hypothetical protein